MLLYWELSSWKKVCCCYYYFHSLIEKAQECFQLIHMWSSVYPFIKLRRQNVYGCLLSVRPRHVSQLIYTHPNPVGPPDVTLIFLNILYLLNNSIRREWIITPLTREKLLSWYFRFKILLTLIVRKPHISSIIITFFLTILTVVTYICLTFFSVTRTSM